MRCLLTLFRSSAIWIPRTTRRPTVVAAIDHQRPFRRLTSVKTPSPAPKCQSRALNPRFLLDPHKPNPHPLRPFGFGFCVRRFSIHPLRPLLVHIRGSKEFLAYFRALEQVRGSATVVRWLEGEGRGGRTGGYLLTCVCRLIWLALMPWVVEPRVFDL